MDEKKLRMLISQGRHFTDESKRLVMTGEQPSTHWDDLVKWKARAHAFISSVDATLLDDAFQLSPMSTPSEIYRALSSTLNDLSALEASTSGAVKNTSRAVRIEPTDVTIKSNSIFIVHGHNEAMKQTVARYISQIGLDPIILHEAVNRGKTIIEKFEQVAASVEFAVVLMSADDAGGPIGQPEKVRPRARQNVVVELGYFSGLLGRSRVCVLISEDVEIPSDYLGVVYTKFDSLGGWKNALAKELLDAGYKVNLTALLK
jgi:predicted nucleotide-binding protein